MDGSALGYFDSVLVIKSLDDLTPQNGLYPLTYMFGLCIKRKC